MAKTIPASAENYEDRSAEIDRRSVSTLARLLATPPDHKQSAKAKANPKKRGRPANSKRAAPRHEPE
jgi:hypothetical protein